MKTAINWFSIPVVHFERAYAFYCFIFDKKFERISDPG
jgi:predicted enzyme related to lactoylglutathione lyase